MHPSTVLFPVSCDAPRDHYFLPLLLFRAVIRRLVSPRFPSCMRLSAVLAEQCAVDAERRSNQYISDEIIRDNKNDKSFFFLSFFFLGVDSFSLTICNVYFFVIQII